MIDCRNRLVYQIQSFIHFQNLSSTNNILCLRIRSFYEIHDDILCLHCCFLGVLILPKPGFLYIYQHDNVTIFINMYYTFTAYINLSITNSYFRLKICTCNGKTMHPGHLLISYGRHRFALPFSHSEHFRNCLSAKMSLSKGYVVVFQIWSMPFPKVYILLLIISDLCICIIMIIYYNKS